MAPMVTLLGQRFHPRRVRFVAQVWPGDRLTTTATVAEVRDDDGHPVADLTLSTVNQADAVVLTGTATVRLG